MKKGTRIYAIRSSDEHTVELYGFGVYDGTTPVTVFGKVRKIPVLQMDDGQTLYGYECWWGRRSKFKAMTKREGVVRNIVMVKGEL